MWLFQIYLGVILGDPMLKIFKVPLNNITNMVLHQLLGLRHLLLIRRQNN